MRSKQVLVAGKGTMMMRRGYLTAYSLQPTAYGVGAHLDLKHSFRQVVRDRGPKPKVHVRVVCAHPFDGKPA